MKSRKRGSGENMGERLRAFIPLITRSGLRNAAQTRISQCLDDSGELLLQLNSGQMTDPNGIKLILNYHDFGYKALWHTHPKGYCSRQVNDLFFETLFFV